MWIIVFCLFANPLNIFNLMGLQPLIASAQGNPNCYFNLNEENCMPLSGPGTAPPTCFGTSLGFSHTALMWVNNSVGLVDVTSRLRQWEGLSSVPECWAVVQPFLCSVYLPKCDEKSKRVEFPSLELCEKTREPCRMVKQFVHDWPEFLRCSQHHFKPNCGGTGAYDKLPYNTTGRCNAPLVRTQKEDSYWKGLKGCGIQCETPLFTKEEHQQAHVFVAVTGCLCLASTLFTILTFLIDWQSASRYPAIILFFINVCFLLATVGWMAQFTFGARNDIICRVDGTQRKAEPQLGSGETAACTIVFVMIYYFTMAGLLWFVMLCYAWHVTFRALGTPRDDLSSKTAYFHLISWSLPLVLTIVCLAISEIDSDSLGGICFVGYHDHSIRAGFVLVPVACVLIVGLFFLIKGLMTLIGIQKDAPEFVGEKAASKITSTIFRIVLFLILAVTFGVVTFAIHIYIFVNESQWESSLDEYLYCQANKTVSESARSNSGPTACTLKNRPSLVAMEINMFAFFGAGIIMSSWSWTWASFSSWNRFLRKVFKKDSGHHISLQRHKMIAQAFENRRDLNNGRMSMSFHSTHDDPLGMKFDHQSLVSSASRMSNFAHNLPLFVQRRGGLIHTPQGRRYSDSDIASVISRRLSQGSLRHHPYPLPHHHHLLGPQYVYVDRGDNSSLNGSLDDGGEWRRRRRRRRKKRTQKKSGSSQPFLGPVLSGMGFGEDVARMGGGGVSRRDSESSVLSKASAQGLHMRHGENAQLRGTGDGSLSSFGTVVNDRVPLGGSALHSGSDVGGVRNHRFGRRRKLPRLAPLSKHRHRSLSSSRSSMNQFAYGGAFGGANAMNTSAYSQYAMNPYLYAAYAADQYAQYYASMGLGYPPYPVCYPTYPYGFPTQPPPTHSGLQSPQPSTHPPGAPSSVASSVLGLNPGLGLGLGTTALGTGLLNISGLGTGLGNTSGLGLGLGKASGIGGLALSAGRGGVGAGTVGLGAAGNVGNAKQGTGMVPSPNPDFSFFSAAAAAAAAANPTPLQSTPIPGAVPSGVSANTATSSPEVERKCVVTASTSRRSEVTIETQQTETISLQELKKTTLTTTMSSTPDFKTSATAAVSDEEVDEENVDDSEEDLNSSQLEDSAEDAEELEDEEIDEEEGVHMRLIAEAESKV